MGKQPAVQRVWAGSGKLERQSQAVRGGVVSYAPWTSIASRSLSTSDAGHPLIQKLALLRSSASLTESSSPMTNERWPRCQIAQTLT